MRKVRGMKSEIKEDKYFLTLVTPFILSILLIWLILGGHTEDYRSYVWVYGNDIEYHTRKDCELIKGKGATKEVLRKAKGEGLYYCNHCKKADGIKND